MRATTTISTLLSASSLLSPVWALSLPSQQEPRLEGKRMANEYISIDLDAVENPGLSKRTNIGYCIADPARSGVCVGVGTLAAAIAFGIATLVQAGSDNKECDKVHKGAVDDVHWQVYAEGGDNCDTTAQLDTIAGAMKVYLSSQGSNICGVKCIKMDHGGTWRGYVAIGNGSEDLDSYHCGSSFAFGNCGSGGNGDI